ncbi:MAG: AAA family ATPase [Prevotellaceae bacterium]|nr:AAA family ATPase [Candidatus Faecinaster equi]
MANNFILLMGKSGSGKTTIANELYNRYGLSSIESYTTRPPRYKGESGHTFISDEEFDELEDMVAYTDFNGYRYCATSEQVEDNHIYIIDPAGVEYFDEHYVGNKRVIVIYLDVDDQTCFERMIQDRGMGEASERIIHDAKAFKDADKIADVCIENYDINATVEKIIHIWRRG